MPQVTHDALVNDCRAVALAAFGLPVRELCYVNAKLLARSRVVRPLKNSTIEVSLRFSNGAKAASVNNECGLFSSGEDFLATNCERGYVSATGADLTVRKGRVETHVVLGVRNVHLDRLLSPHA